MDRKKGYSINSLRHNYAEPMDLAQKPEWYLPHPLNCNTDVARPYRTRSRASSSYDQISTQMAADGTGDTGRLPLHPEWDAPVIHCRDTEHSSKTNGGFMNVHHERVHSNMWHAGFFKPDHAEPPAPESSGGTDSDSSSDVIFLVSTAKDSFLCSSLSRGSSSSPAVEPLCPAALSLDGEGRGCFPLPQALTSPSPDCTSSEDSSDSSGVIPMQHARPMVLLSDLHAVYRTLAESPIDISSDDSDEVIEVSVSNRNERSRIFPDRSPRQDSSSCEDAVRSESESTEPRRLRHSTRIRKLASATPEFTPRGSSHHNLRSKGKSVSVGVYNECYDSGDVMDSADCLSSSEKEESLSGTQRTSTALERYDAPIPTGRSPSKPEPLVQQTHRKSPRRTHHAAQEKSVTVITPESARLKTKPKPKPKRGRRVFSKRPAEVTAAKNKGGGRKCWRRKKGRAQAGPPAVFSPEEAETIKRKLASLKEKRKKESQSGSGFQPFVHMERRVCTVVNYQEEKCGGPHHAKATKASSSSPSPGSVPRTSCFRLGRLTSQGKGQECTQVCCLCGCFANAVGLGDLHGPYYPVGPPQGPTLANGRTWPKEAEEEEQEGLNGDQSVKNETVSVLGDGDGSSSIMAATTSDLGTPAMDARTPKESAPSTDERWVHEDCGIWSAGVFLVKGRLYGLKEAATLARETVCSSCHEPGAIMGCFLKGCPENYHYRCAIRSGCVLNEENFSMRCSKHKNKVFNSVNQHKR